MGWLIRPEPNFLYHFDKEGLNVPTREKRKLMRKEREKERRERF